jgi:hypothetical protein
MVTAANFQPNYRPDPTENPVTIPSREFGPTGSGVGQVYVDKAPAAPDDPTQAALSYPSGGGGIQQWDVLTQSWV